MPPVSFINIKDWSFFGSRRGRLTRSSEDPCGLRSFPLLGGSVGCVTYPSTVSSFSWWCCIAIVFAGVGVLAGSSSSRLSGPVFLHLRPWCEVSFDLFVSGRFQLCRRLYSGIWSDFQRFMLYIPLFYNAFVFSGRDDYKFETHRELATSKTAWIVPASEEMRRTSPIHGLRWRSRTVPEFPNDLTASGTCWV